MLTLINPLHLSKLWHMLKPGIEEMLDDLNKDCLQELWVPEDVYASIKCQESQLWLGDEGFVVTQINQDRFTGTKIFYIWLAYSFIVDKNIIDSDYIQLKEYAKQIGCEMIKFLSIRKGYLRRSKELGFHVGPTYFTERI